MVTTSRLQVDEPVCASVPAPPSTITSAVGKNIVVFSGPPAMAAVVDVDVDVDEDVDVDVVVERPTVVVVVVVVEPPGIVVVVVVVELVVVVVVDGGGPVGTSAHVRLEADWPLIVMATSQKLLPSTTFEGFTQAMPMWYVPAGIVALLTIRCSDNCGTPVTRNGDDEPGFSVKAAPLTFGRVDTNVVPLPVPDAGKGRPRRPKSTDDNVTPEPMK